MVEVRLLRLNFLYGWNNDYVKILFVLGLDLWISLLNLGYNGNKWNGSVF